MLSLHTGWETLTWMARSAWNARKNQTCKRTSVKTDQASCISLWSECYRWWSCRHNGRSDAFCCCVKKRRNRHCGIELQWHWLKLFSHLKTVYRLLGSASMTFNSAFQQPLLWTQLRTLRQSVPAVDGCSSQSTLVRYRLTIVLKSCFNRWPNYHLLWKQLPVSQTQNNVQELLHCFRSFACQVEPTGNCCRDYDVFKRLISKQQLVSCVGALFSSSLLLICMSYPGFVSKGFKTVQWPTTFLQRLHANCLLVQICF